MSKHTMAGAPVCTWVAVTDASGRTHMEARWSVEAAAAVDAPRPSTAPPPDRSLTPRATPPRGRGSLRFGVGRRNFRPSGNEDGRLVVRVVE